jgi:hypothetical protein
LFFASLLFFPDFSNAKIPICIEYLRIRLDLSGLSLRPWQIHRLFHCIAVLCSTL